MISSDDFLYFFKKNNFVNIKIILNWPSSAVFLINSCFKSSSINAKNKFWDVPHFLHMSVILLSYIYYHSNRYRLKFID